jgi:hypothetical protein
MSLRDPVAVSRQITVLQLAMMRATAIICGGAMYVLHVGDMVAGRENPAIRRHANVWQVHDIDKILRAVRGIDELLPEGVENWSKLQQGRDVVPLTADAFISSGGDHGVSSVYVAADDARFVMVVNGVLRHVTFTATAACRVTAFEPLTRTTVSTATLAPGQKWTLAGREDTMTAYIVHGTLTRSKRKTEPP